MEEIRRRLESIDAPSFEEVELGVSMRFEVSSLSSAKVVWTNTGFFLEEGIDPFESKNKRYIENWILENFAVEARNGASSERYLFADSYGSTGGSTIGGSGRAGALGKYNAKGIGATPLSAENVDFEHRHGHLRLNDALRECINSIIADIELGGRSIPVIAIVLTSKSLKSVYHEGSEPCAIVVRKNALRGAHFERSIYFGDSGYPESAQERDARRVRTHIQRGLSSKSKLIPNGILLECASLIAHTHVERLWMGQFVSSNVTAYGELLDFGAFRSVYSWERATSRLNQSFGGEIPALLRFSASLQSYYEKYFQESRLDSLLRVEDTEITNHYWSEVSRLYGERARLSMGCDSDSKFANEFAGVLLEYFKKQQNISFSTGTRERSKLRRPWISHLLPAGRKYRDIQSDCATELTYNRLNEVIGDHQAEIPVNKNVGLLSLGRWLKPKTELLMEHSLLRARSVAIRSSMNEIGVSERIGTHINYQVAKALRNLPDKPWYLLVLQQAYQDGTIVCYCWSLLDNQPIVFITCPVLDDLVFVCGESYSVSDFMISEITLVSRSRATISLTLHSLRRSDGNWLVESHRGLQVKLPQSMFRY